MQRMFQADAERGPGDDGKDTHTRGVGADDGRERVKLPVTRYTATV